MEQMLSSVPTSMIRVEATTYNFKEGDVVILKDDLLKQRTWPLAWVTKMFPGGISLYVQLTCGTRTRYFADLLPTDWSSSWRTSPAPQ